MPLLQLYLLGGFRLVRNAEPIEIPSKKARALLCRLAVEPGVFRSREQLATLLWPDSDSPAARQSLRQTLADLRRALKPDKVLNANNDQVALKRDAIWIDVSAFVSASKRSDIPSIEQALDLYQGEFLEGLAFRLPEYEDWLLVMREHLRQHAVNLCEVLTDRCDLDAAASIALHNRLLQLEPTLEQAHRSLMEIYISEGDDAAAIKQYLSCQAILERELGIKPDADTKSLYQALLEHRMRVAPKTDLTLPESAPRVEQLRPVSVLALRMLPNSSKREAGETQWQVSSDKVDAIARQYGGRLVQRLDQFALLAFGLDTAHGTEVDRSRLAAEALGRMFQGAAFGITSGQLLYRPNPPQLMGETATFAIELAQAAGSGEIWLSDSARHALRVCLSTKQVAPNAWCVVPATKAASERAPIIGRELELRQFVVAMDACRDTYRGCVILIRGEAGIGKSRLLEEYHALGEPEGFTICSAQILDFGTEHGADPVAQVTRQLAKLHTVSEDLEPRLAGLISQELLPFAMDILGGDLNTADTDILTNLTPATRTQKRAMVLQQLLAKRCRDRPVLLLIEDIHWADMLTIDLLARLASAVYDLPALLVMTMRIEGEPLDPKWRGALQGAPLMTLDLQPLHSADAAMLARRLGVQESNALQQLVARAGGIPLFLEQLAVGGLATETLPTTIQSLVVARFDALPHAAQRTLMAASVIGQQFSQELISAVLKSEPELGTLSQHGLLRETEHGWRFHHAMIREGVYQHLLESEREPLHRNAAAYYQTVDPVLYAQHLDLAGSPLAGRALLEASRFECVRLHPAWALPLLQRVLDKYPILTYEALMLQGDIQRQLGYVTESHVSFDQALKLATTDIARAQCLLGRGMAHDLLDKLDTAIADLTTAAKLAKGHDDILADIYLHLGNALFPLDDMDACLEAHKTSLRHAELSGKSEQAARAEGGLGDAYYQRAAMRTANHHYGRCVTIAETHQHLAAVPGNFAMQGLTTMFIGDMKTAVAQAERALALSTQTGDLRHELIAHNTLGMLQVFRGDTERGVHYAGWAVELGEQLGSRRFQIDSLGQLAHLHWCREDLDKASLAIEQGMELLDHELMPFGGPYLYGLRALTVAKESERMAMVHAGLELLDAGAISHSHLLFYVTALQSALYTADAEQVLELAQRLRRYTQSEPLPWANFFIDRVILLSGLFMGNPEIERDRLQDFAISHHLNSRVAALP